MGYSEAYCHLCGVSFNIARRRKPREPDLASWNYAGHQDDYLSVEEVEDLLDCAKKGCCIAVKQPKDEDQDDLVEDLDYVPQEDIEDELEYNSEHESIDAMSIDGEEDDHENENMEATDPYRDFLARTIMPQKRLSGEPLLDTALLNTNRNEIILPLTSGDIPEGYDIAKLEHIPGPSCEEARAYSGHAISLQEMRGCRTAQFLIHKSVPEQPWQPDSLHESWEMTEDYFLSGLADGMASRDESDQDVRPARGGVKIVRADNINFDPEWTPADDIAMPFHPWCFDIFSRQSKAQFGKVNVSGLMKWRNSDFGWEYFHEFPRDADVFRAQEQFWEHRPGSEYLAANPLYVPGLSAFLMNAANGRMADDLNAVKPSQYINDTTPILSQASGVDFLSSLLLDIRLLLVDYLGPAEITNLRMASRAFTELPNGVWYRLLREEMPWLWEAWNGFESSHVPSPWTLVTANEVKMLYKQRKRYLSILGDEYKPTDKILDYLIPLPHVVPDQMQLPRDKTDWHQVYARIKCNWSKLKGLRNRKRIWEDVEEIIQRMEEFAGQESSRALAAGREIAV